ncbi:Fungalysin metallopeptidase-domain-containing protein [Globomyces pollinis-pini]|nr:Fungalysin metallopeptidase-domain-containing protein [Globomyces pollinis-pini]
MQYKELTSLALFLAVNALPTSNDVTYIKRENTNEIPFYYPAVTSKSFPVPQVASFAKPTEEDVLRVAREALKKEFKLSDGDFTIKQHHTDREGVTHVYAIRTIDGVPVDNNNCAVHLKGDSVVSMSTSFTGSIQKRSNTVATATVTVPLEEAVGIASKELGVERDDFPSSLVYIQVPGGKIVYAHQFQLKSPDSTKWFQVTSDTATGKIVQVVDYVSHANFTVLGLPKNDPRESFDKVVDPAFIGSSPKGWNEDGQTKYTDSQGNNVISTIKKVTTDGGKKLDFTTAFNAKEEPSTEGNKRVAIVNNFYISNMMHDISYQYGFTEDAGNFQQYNFGKGGKEGDRVKVNNQASGSNNANFATPPDGQSGVMNMYTWDSTTPNRDGSLDNAIPIHEYTHGISNRLTGGSSQASCLNAKESRGMGEGWGDTLAMYLTRKETDIATTPFILADYADNNPKGIRHYPYSTDLKVNPYTYSSLNGLSSVHNIGEIWAVTLNEVYWNLVEKYGYSSNWFDPKQTKGNIMAMNLVMSGLKLQPCNPTFLDARNAILKADELYYKGENRCLLWKAFAKRGMGDDVIAAGYKDGFKVPANC